MIACLENLEFKVTKVEINEINRLLNKLGAQEERIKNKLRQLVEIESDMSVMFELESLIA